MFAPVFVSLLILSSSKNNFLHYKENDDECTTAASMYGCAKKKNQPFVDKLTAGFESTDSVVKLHFILFDICLF
jgi:hypothetical protein